MVHRNLLFLAILFSNILASNSLNSINNFTANFNQIITNDLGKKIDYKGKIFVKKSGKILWKYEKPILKNIYILNKLVIVDEPQLEQAIYTNIDKSINFKKIIDKAKQISKNKYKALLFHTQYFIKLKDGKINSLFFKDNLENTILIKFFNVKQNINIDDSIFNFFPPNYYDVIRK